MAVSTIGDRPTVDPQHAWDDSLATPTEANVTVPSTGNKRSGYTSGQKPTAQRLNWVLSTLYQWIYYLKTVVSPYESVAPASGWTVNSATAPRVYDAQGAVGSLSTGAAQICVPISGLRSNKIVEVNVDVLEAGTAGEEITLRLFEQGAGSGGALNQIGDTITSGVTGATATHTWNDSTNDSVAEIPHTVAANTRLFLIIDFTQTTTNDEAIVYKVRVERD